MCAKRSRRLSWQILACSLICLVLLVSLTACGPQETNLPFETIEKTDFSVGYNEKDPRLVIIAEAGEVGALENMVTATAQAQVRNLDFDQYLTIAVFQGRKGTNGYDAEIQRVARRENSITVYAHFTERNPKLTAADILTSPYHLVKVQKGGIQGEVLFILSVDGKIVGQRTHRIR